MSTLLAFIESNFADPDVTTRIVAPTIDGYNVDVGDSGDSTWLIINPTVSATNASVSLPSSTFAVNDQEITIVVTALVDVFSITSAGATVVGAPNQIATYDSFKLKYNASQLTWYTLDGTATSSDLVSYLASGTGAVLRTVQDALRGHVSAADFGASPSASASVNAAAINAALATGRSVYLPGGIYATDATINLTTTASLIGEGRNLTRINYSGTDSAIKCALWNNEIRNLSVYTATSTANGIEVGNTSRNCGIYNVYIDATATGAINTGSGIYLNAENGFSGGITISTTYVIQFKYGILCRGVDTAFNTWTTLAIYNFWAVGYSPAVIGGSAGIYMDSKTNGIGSVMMGGTLEAFAAGISIEDGSFGGVFETDMEGNNIPFEVGNAFSGRIVTAFGDETIRSSKVAPGSFSWHAAQRIQGKQTIIEDYYPTKRYLAEGSQFPYIESWSRVLSPVIDGYVPLLTSEKFAIGMGRNGFQDAETDPNNHFIRVGGRSVHWDTQSPVTTGGGGYWIKGSVCYNSVPAIGQPTGWMCTFSGTEGTLNAGATTGSITIGTTALVVSDATGLIIGQHISIAGVTGTRRIVAINGTAITIDTLADATVSGAAVAWVGGTWVALANL
tara:strand:- start:974 stop:2830 length:1857 start_codon:yes stop_codon:yes gene_type:complete